MVVTPHSTVGRRKTARPEDRRLLRKWYEQLTDEPIQFIDHPMFEKGTGKANVEALRPIRDGQRARPTGRPPKGLPPFLEMLYGTSLLTPDEERYLFCRMNFLKCRAVAVLDSIRADRPSRRKLESVQRDVDAANELRNQIVQTNLRLVVAIAKKFVTPTEPLEDLFSEGYLPIMRAAELFDFSRGNRFSTYATWAVRNHLLRRRSLVARRAQRFPATEGTLVEEVPDERSDENESLRQRERRSAMVASLLELIPQREQTILAARFGLGEFAREHTLKEIGCMFGLSKERVRQLAIRSIEAMQQTTAEMPGVELSL